MATSDSKSTGRITATVLVAIAGLHVAWGMGSSYPFQSRDELADSVVGTSEVPSPMACMAVAGLLVLAAALVAGFPPLPKRVRAIALRVVTAVDSPTFARLDKRLYSPLCLWLAAGVRRSI